MTLTENAGSERFFGQLVTQGYFETLGLQPLRAVSFFPERSARRVRSRRGAQLQRLEDSLQQDADIIGKDPGHQRKLHSP